MEVDRVNQYDSNDTNSIQIKILMGYILKQLDNFLLFISDRRKEIIEPYIIQIEEDLDKMIKKESYEYNFFKDYEKSLELNLLHAHPELFNKMRIIIEISFNLKEYKINPDEEKVTIKTFDRFKGMKIPLYTYLLVLTKILPREETIELYKEFLEEGVKYNQRSPPSMENIDDMLKLYKENFPKTHIFSLFKIQEGKVGCKLNRCMIYEALLDFDIFFDKEIGFLTSCYNDYIHARSVNKHFILTRKKTIMEGEDICDFCWHDTQIIDSVEHPTNEFWESID